ncbi:hypothetical protein GGF46_005304, partial [Coemansia sp. RSA 552]
MSCEDSASSNDPDDTHPYVTYNWLASSNMQAGPSFVNEHLGQQPAEGHSGPAAAAIVKSRRGLSAGQDDAPEAHPGLLSSSVESLLEAHPDADDDAASRRIEAEVRRMMQQTALPEMADVEGTSESAQELKRIGGAFSRCMELRDKYMA